MKIIPIQHMLDSEIGTVATNFNIPNRITYITTICPANDPDKNYLFGGGSYTLIGMEYENHKYGYQFATCGGNLPGTKHRALNKGIWSNWETYVTNTDLQTAIATGNTVRQCVNATTNSQTKKFLIARPDDAPIYESSRALLTVTKYTTFTFLMLHSSLNEVFVAFLYESDNITPSIWKRMDNTVRNLATQGRLGLDYNATTKILSLYFNNNRIGTINVN